MKVFALKSCDTCAKALRELRVAGHDPQVIDVRVDGVARTDLARFLAAFGGDLINKRSTTWRAMPESEKADDPIDLLVRYPTLMKRPVIEFDDQLFLGWRPDVQRQLLG